MSIHPGNAPSTFHLMAKPTGPVCNLACKYCFYREKESLYPGSHFRMSANVLDAYIKQLLMFQQSPEVCVAWQGGEPTLMGLDFFQSSIELVKKYKRPGQQATYTLQTNGTRVDDVWCAFFKNNNFLIGLSIDGPPDLHDAYRVNKGGKGSFKQVKKAWELLQKHGVDTNILCAVHAANASHPLGVYRFFRDELQARFLQFIPIVERLAPGSSLQVENGQPGMQGEKRSTFERENQLVSPRSVKPEQYGHFLIDIFDAWVHYDVGKVFVQAFDSALAGWCGFPANVCIFQETCGLSLVLEHNGDVYSCDHFVVPDHRLGNIMVTPLLELVSASCQIRFGLDKRDRLPDNCRGCDVRFVCHGECPRNRFLKSVSDETENCSGGNLNYLCAGYKMFFHHIDRPMRAMATLLRQQRAPAEIMQM